MAVRQTELLIVAIMAVACTPEPSRSESSVVFDTLDGVVHVSNLAAHDPSLQWSVGDPSLRIGSVLGGDEQAFGSIGGVVVDGDRRIYIGDGQALEIRVFDESGEFLFKFGREGRGPGEFENIDALLLNQIGEILIRDVSLGRVSVFGIDGEFRRQFLLDRLFSQSEGRPTLWATPDGRVFDWLKIGDTPPADSAGVAVYDASGALENIVVTSVHNPQTIALRRGETPFAWIDMPMTPIASAGVDRIGRIISGFGSQYRIDVLDPSGTLLSRVTREVDPEVTPAWLADSVAARIERLRDIVGGGVADSYDLPEFRPQYTRIFVDDVDHWWVARDGDHVSPATHYDIYGPEGVYLGELQLPPIKLMQVGLDFVAGVVIDELGIERAVVLPLVRREH